MPEQEFKEWYDWVKQRAEEYQDVGLRTSVITGFFSAKSREVFTGEQVLQLLELRYPEEKSTCIGWGATGALTNNQLYCSRKDRKSEEV